MDRRSFINRLTTSTALASLFTPSAISTNTMPTTDSENKLYYDIRDFGAKANAKNVNASIAIEKGLNFLASQETGGILVIPDGRFYCLTSINFPRGKKQQPLMLKGLSHSSILDFTKCTDETVFIADFSSSSGPPYIGFDNIYFLGHLPTTEKKAKNFALLKKCSQMEVHRCRFDRFNRLFSIYSSYALRFMNCDFQDIESDVFAFYTNAHDFRCLNTHSYNVSKNDGAFFNFLADKLTHNIRISGDYEKIGTLIKCSSAGLAGLNMNDCYTEQPSRQLFMFGGNIRGFSFNNGSFSDGKNDASTQIIDNVVSGTLHGNYIYKSHVKFGPNTQAIEVSGAHVIGRGSLQSAKTFSPDLTSQGFEKQSGYGTVKYCKDLQGRVTFEGHAIATKKTGKNTLLFTLQENFRPELNQEFICTSSIGLITVKVQADGQVILIQNISEGEMSQKISLNGVSFLSK